MDRLTIIVTTHRPAWHSREFVRQMTDGERFRWPLDARCAAGFRPLLSGAHALEALEAHPASVVGLWPDTTIAYVNPAWLRFAHANGGREPIESNFGLGGNYLDAISPTLRPFYAILLEAAPTAEESLHPPVHEYECSSAAEYRRFAMHVYALPGRAGWLVVNSLLVEHTHDPATHAPHEPVLSEYLHNGLLTQCAHCRRIRHVADPLRWDWVPDWVTRPMDCVSHGMCPTCYHHYQSTE